MTCNNEYGVGWGEVFSVGELVAVCLSTLDWKFNSIQSNEIKLPVNKTKWISLLGVKILGLDLCKI